MGHGWTGKKRRLKTNDQLAEEVNKAHKLLQEKYIRRES